MSASPPPADPGGLLDLATAHFTERCGTRPAYRWFVPGRIEVFGKHTDYAGGESLLAAVPRGFAVVAAPRSDHALRVMDGRHHDEIIIPIGGTDPYRGWANYAAVTVRRLAANFEGAPLGADIAIASNLPRAAGVSSSSALVVGLGLALIRRAELERRDDWRAAIGSLSDLAWYLGCLENGLTYRQLAGTAGVGTQGGSQDHTAILACLEGVISRYGFMPVQHLGDVRLPEEWTFVILSSGVHADKAGSVRERYNRASAGVQALLRIWQSGTGRADVSLTTALRSAEDAEARLRVLLASTPVEGFTVADLERRLDMLTGELRRIPVAQQAIAAGDADLLGRVTDESQHDAERLLGNQIPETVALARIARAQGAIAASAFGAGFGGSVWALAPTSEAEAFAERWHAAYVEACRPSGHVEWFCCRPSAGARQVD